MARLHEPKFSRPKPPGPGLPRSLAIAIWLTGSTWAVAIVARVFDAPYEITTAAAAFGLLAGIVEWLVLRESNR